MAEAQGDRGGDKEGEKAKVDAVLFACTHNIIRSALAEALMKELYGSLIYVDSVGVRFRERDRGQLVRYEPADPLACACAAEIGVDLSRHRSKTFEMLMDASFDVIVALSPEAMHHVLDWSRHMACEVWHWMVFDPSLTEGSLEARRTSYRMVRDDLRKRIVEAFGG